MYSQHVEMYLNVEPVRYTFHAGQVLAICKVSRRSLFVHLSGFLHWLVYIPNPSRMFGPVSKWAWWFEHQYQLSKCTVVSEQWRTFLRD